MNIWSINLQVTMAPQEYSTKAKGFDEVGCHKPLALSVSCFSTVKTIDLRVRCYKKARSQVISILATEPSRFIGDQKFSPF